MSLITETFGKKIKGEELKKLMKILDISEDCLQNLSGGWVVDDYWGRCTAKVEKRGIEMDFYIFRKDLHIGGTESVHQTEKYHFRKTVPYENIQSIF